MDSDVDVSGWVLELLLRDRDKECIAKRVLAVAPFSAQDYRLKKTVLLRTIECEVHDASVSETTLETLELIEDLDTSHGFDASDSMKAAYLAVATECTVKFLVGLMGTPGGKYLDAVDRIWRGRVAALERSETSQLVTAELRQRMDEVEAGVWESRVSRKLAKMNTRNEALRLLAVYVKEAMAILGPPVITWAVRLNVSKEVSDLEGNQIVVGNVANVGGGSGVLEAVQTKIGANVSDRLRPEVQMENGGNGSDRSHPEVQMDNGTNVVDGSEPEAQMVKGTNVGDVSEIEVETVNGSELEVETVNRTNVGDRSQLEDSQTGNRTNAGNGSLSEEQTSNGTNVPGEMKLKEQPVNGSSIGDGCELQAQIVNEANVSNGSELGPQPMSGVQFQEAGAGSSPPTVNRGLVENDSGFTNREVHRLADDQVRGEVNATGVPLPSANRVLAFSSDPTVRDKETQRSTTLRHKHLANRRSRGPVKIRAVEDLDIDLSNRKYDSLSSPEVSKAQEELKSSMLELRAVVTDPLPDSLRVADTVRSDLAMKSGKNVNEKEKDGGAENPTVEMGAGPVNSHNDNLGNLSSSHQHDVPQSSAKEKNVPNPPVNRGKGKQCVQTDNANPGNPPDNQGKGTDSAQTDHANPGNPPDNQGKSTESAQTDHANPGNPPDNQGKSTEFAQTDHASPGNPSCSKQNNVPRPSLMERNPTAHTYEWSDSIDASQEGTKDTGRLHLPSPKRKAVSPLKKYVDKKLTKRRKVKRWSLMEEDALRAGVQKFGAGNWKFILNSYRSIFEERTEVDLKDKWRNMTRY